MRLKSFRVERFRNVLDSGEVPVDDAITCLVGKNESGKTNLLHALHTLNPALKDRVLDDKQYPRWLEKQHKRSGEFASARPIRATFLLDEQDVAEIEGLFGQGVLATDEWTCSLDYAGMRWFNVEVDEEAACSGVEQGFGIHPGATTVEALKGQLAGVATMTEADEDGAQQPTATATAAAGALAELNTRFPETVREAVGPALFQRMPRFFYFDDYSRLDGRTDIGPLIGAIRSGTQASLAPTQRTALALLGIAFATDQLVDVDYEKRSGEMEAVAAELTQRVRSYWHQNDHLLLRIDVEAEDQPTPDGTRVVHRYLQLRVQDDRHYFTNSLDARSSGFRWFVSFLAAFTDFESDESVIVLLDEPALALHARAQADFLAFVEETLAGRHQVLFTTHSPFMVDPGHLERVRVVEDNGPDLGATAKTQLMSRDPDTLSPLQGALGYDIAQNIFVGPDNLVVEGLSDYTYLTVMSEPLRAAGRQHLDPRWRILPAGGAGTMPAAITLLGRELDVTVVVDGGSRPPQRLSGLVDGGLLDGKRIIMLGLVVGTKSADIEDLLHPEDFLGLYNAALGATVTLSDLDPEGRIVERIERAFGKFNHNDPSNYLLANRDAVVGTLRPESLDGFERLFEGINATLTSARTT